jgi:uncharacterized protein YukE
LAKSGGAIISPLFAERATLSCGQRLAHRSGWRFWYMARTIRVNTDDLWMASKRYERLAGEIDDISAQMQSARTDLDVAHSRDDYLIRADAITRKSNGIAYFIRELSGKLMYAASRYEEYDRHIRQTSTDTDYD